MSLNVTEAHAVNTLLERLTGIRNNTGRAAPTDEQVRQAAVDLANGAYRRLAAGLRPDQLEQDWPTDPLFAVTRHELAQLAGRALTADEAVRIRTALANSSIPDAVEAVLSSVLGL